MNLRITFTIKNKPTVVVDDVKSIVLLGDITCISFDDKKDIYFMDVLSISPYVYNEG